MEGKYGPTTFLPLGSKLSGKGDEWMNSKVEIEKMDILQ